MNSAVWLSQEIKDKIKTNLGPDLTRDGWLVVKSDRTTSRSLNMADALEKLRSNIRAAEQPTEESFQLLEVEVEKRSRFTAWLESIGLQRFIVIVILNLL